MLSPRGLVSLTCAAFLLYSPISAAPTFESKIRHNVLPRQATGNPADAPTALLEPVVPPVVNEDSLSVLRLNTNVTLAWAGSNGAQTTDGKFKRDEGAVLTEASITFRYPTVPLDHSNFVSGLSCSKGKLTGKLTDKAYAYAKQRWTAAGKIVFITSVDGCGADSTNDYFLANTVSFSDAQKTFTAQGAEAAYKQVASKVHLQWGDVGVMPIKRAINKRELFEPHPLHKRKTVDFSFTFSQYLNQYIGVDSDAPWDNAALLIKFGKEDGKEDKAWQKGEAKNKTAAVKKMEGTRKAKVEKGVDYGLKVYCVECGFGGGATIYGTLDWDIGFFDIDVTKAEVGMNMNMKAGINIGLEAYVLYKREYTKQLARVNLAGWEIPLFVDVGPFISVSVQPGVVIKASGTLLVGANVVWDAIEVKLDMLNSGGSYSRGWTPRFQPTLEVGGELKMEAYLGLPIKLGLGVNILSGTWEADASIVDTPKIVAEGKFAISAALSPSGKIVPDYNGGCYGIAWNIHFENTLQAVFSGKYIGEKAFDIIKPFESDPFAEGCLGMKDPGVDSGLPDYNPIGQGTGTGLGGNGLNSGGTGLGGSPNKGLTNPAATTTTTASSSSTGTPSTPNKPKCTPDLFQINPSKPAGISCAKYVPASQVQSGNKPKLAKEFDADSSDVCNYNCLITKDCVSASYTDKKKCTLYRLPVKDLATTSQKNAPNWQFWDKSCFSFTKC
ncbi:Putative PAN/Apple domain-containing protein [Septoria linicola]|uniref:PAN/Apple domain-containing protein n=1 Tax=Septoria linicola TaxID=215465 RepID=A0A9Q9EI16_9PEZI|nr:putative PAN/Apple domain-containing protein [Septoria linicola]USW51555.1 Putative PAN/Apple domain-containing protein [Septoria linicola]